MNIRYRFITPKEEYKYTNSVRNALLAAKNGQDVDDIMNAILTTDEIIKIGRRIEIAKSLAIGINGEEIKTLLSVGRDTITMVAKHMAKYPRGFELIYKRKRKVEKEYEEKKYKKVGGSQLVFKKKEYTGITRKDIER